jgi:hypothetical protein
MQFASIRSQFKGLVVLSLTTAALLLSTSSVQAASKMFTEQELEAALMGVWTGEWSNMQRGTGGTLTLSITNAGNGTFSGTGQSDGGPCKEPFAVSGRYKGNQVALRILFKSEECGEVRVSLQGGIIDDGSAMLGGSWGLMAGGQPSAQAFGIVTFTKK